MLEATIYLTSGTSNMTVLCIPNLQYEVVKFTLIMLEVIIYLTSGTCNMSNQCVHMMFRIVKHLHEICVFFYHHQRLVKNIKWVATSSTYLDKIKWCKCKVMIDILWKRDHTTKRKHWRNKSYMRFLALNMLKYSHYVVLSPCRTMSAILAIICTSKVTYLAYIVLVVCWSRFWWCYMIIQTVRFIFMRNYFPKRPSGALLHTLSKLYDVPVGFVTPPPYFEAVSLLYLRSPKGGCCSISDDMSSRKIQNI